MKTQTPSPPGRPEIAPARPPRKTNGNGAAAEGSPQKNGHTAMAKEPELKPKQLLDALIAFKRGDFSYRLPNDLSGVDGKIADTFNDVIEINQRMAKELERVSRVVGREGIISQRASLGMVTGTWADSITFVNTLITDLVHPTSETARVIGAVAKGDLSQAMALDIVGRPLKGEFLKTAKTVNTMVEQLGSFAAEVTRVAREVGTEGKLGGQALVKGVAGTWKDLTDSVNSMAGNLTGQVRNIAAVTTAVANGDLSKKITVDVKGEILELKNTINTMVDQLRSFASEVTRVAREVGTEGKLGGQADVPGVAGTWKDLTDSVNSMAGNLTSQVRNIAAVTTAVANGDLSKKITVDVKGEIRELKDTINTMVDQLNSFASEVTRVAREVGTEGKLGGQAQVVGVAGTWKDLTDNVNSMAGNLTSQVRNIAAVTTAVANGDLSKKITVDVKGEIRELKDTINTMLDQLNSFASEVTRVAREVGTEGKLGGQAEVKGVAGTWKDLTDNVNFMAGNLTNQVRGIAKVVTAVANGDLKQKLAVDAKGEIAALADTINGMIETLATFADEVTTVAREVGFEGKLGGQARVPGASGTWKDLTDNVNQLAGNLTNQVRAIAEVATAVTKGDLTRSIAVEARGEVAALKDNINEMIRNLKDTTLKNSEQDWLKTNLAKFSRMLQGQKDLITVGRLILSELAPVVSAQHGVFYTMDTTKDEPVLKLLASYAYKERKHIDTKFKLGEGLVGQCALEKQKILLTNVPNDYIQITSGLGEAPPLNIIVMPVVFEGQVKGVLELAAFERFSATYQAFLDQLTESIGIVLNTIEANMRTEDLLKQSQSLANELQSRQQELQNTNAELQEKAKLLADQNMEVEGKNREVEQARQALEEKAKQLALTSKYKSEFLANMSHELRTPLNSLLILSDRLSRNTEANLTAKQVEFAKTIHASGTDLLTLINDILDLSKIESGTVTPDIGEVTFRDLREYVERAFRYLAENKKLGFRLEMDPKLPKAMRTDAKRLQQVLKNLLSNAFKFTERGEVSLSVQLVESGWNPEHEVLSRAKSVIALSVRDTGIGIPMEKQQIIFEAFQQADGSTSRKYGGTGLGLAISRELARLLGGEIRLESIPGEGSMFTLYLPLTYMARKTSAKPADWTVPVPEPERPEVEMVEAIAVEEPNVDLIDDSTSVQPGDHVVLIVENDEGFARFLLDVAHENQFKALVATRGATAFTMATEYRPDAITLDINLPDIDGWRILGRLKEDPRTRHIPVQIITTEEEQARGLRMGAMGVLTKPLKTKDALDETFVKIKQFTESRIKRLLIVMPDDGERTSLSDLLGGDDAEIVSVGTAQEALTQLKDKPFDVLVMDLKLPDRKAFDFIDDVGEQPRLANLPILVYTVGELSKKEETQLKRLTQTMVLKDVRSPGRLIDEVALFLHRAVETMPSTKREMLEKLHEQGGVLEGKSVLVVDDDIRNIFAMTSLLEPQGMQVFSAETGKSAIEILESQSDIDVVLMDIMMPDMDGYETIQAIRKLGKFRALPILALTAKAMKGDREKCIEAGASDYIAKPVDTTQLLSLLRVWLYR